MTAQDTTLVIGASGKTGRRVAERLRARDVPVRAGSRSGAPPFDWEDRSTWGPALDGATSAYVSFYPDLAVPGAPEAIAALAEAALGSGTRRLVLLSGRGEEEAQRAERALQASGVPEWTIVRCSWFNQNFSENYFLEPLLAGELALPVGAVPEPFVDVEDIADVATAALTEDGHVGRLYELTGPRLLSFEEAVGEIAAAAGRPIRYVQVPLDAWLAEMAEAGEPEDTLSLLGFLFSEVLDGRNAQLANGVQEALGREPRDFRDFARAAAASGLWTP
jgi:uncharacterized protein YbjT (DUF2867 family)